MQQRRSIQFQISIHLLFILFTFAFLSFVFILVSFATFSLLCSSLFSLFVIFGIFAFTCLFLCSLLPSQLPQSTIQICLFCSLCDRFCGLLFSHGLLSLLCRFILFFG